WVVGTGISGPAVGTVGRGPARWPAGRAWRRQLRDHARGGRRVRRRRLHREGCHVRSDLGTTRLDARPSSHRAPRPRLPHDDSRRRREAWAGASVSGHTPAQLIDGIDDGRSCLSLRTLIRAEGSSIALDLPSPPFAHHNRLLTTSAAPVKGSCPATIVSGTE